MKKIIVALNAVTLAVTFLYPQQSQSDTIDTRTVAIVEKPIDFGPERIALTKSYIRTHYGFDVKKITIIPKIVVIHYTAIDSLNASYRTLKPERLRGRSDISDASALNVSAHFLIDKDGTVYRLMPETYMARHVIGLNFNAIGIENVAKNAAALTSAQLKANAALIRYLKRKYPTLTYLIGHHEYRKMETSPLWLEKDPAYRTRKSDPGEAFMRRLRAALEDLELKKP